MIETLLRTITNRGIWKFIWLPHISTITLRSNEPLTYDTNFPLSHDSLLIRGYDRRYLCIPSSTSLPISTLFSFPWYVIPCEPVTCLQANWMTFHREGPEYIYPSYGWTNPTLDPCVSTNTFRTLNATFIATQLRCGVWCHQKHPSGKGDMHDLMVEGIRLLCIRKHIAIELLKWLDLYAMLTYRSMSTISFS